MPEPNWESPAFAEAMRSSWAYRYQHIETTADQLNNALVTSGITLSITLSAGGIAALLATDDTLGNAAAFAVVLGLVTLFLQVYSTLRFSDHARAASSRIEPSIKFPMSEENHRKCLSAYASYSHHFDMFRLALVTAYSLNGFSISFALIKAVR